MVAKPNKNINTHPPTPNQKLNQKPVTHAPPPPLPTLPSKRSRLATVTINRTAIMTH